MPKKFIIKKKAEEKPKPKGLPPSKAQAAKNKKEKELLRRRKGKPFATQGDARKIPDRITSAENIMMGMKKTGTNQYYITQLEKKIKALKKRQSLNVEITSKKK